MKKGDFVYAVRDIPHYTPSNGMAIPALTLGLLTDNPVEAVSLSDGEAVTRCFVRWAHQQGEFYVNMQDIALHTKPDAFSVAWLTGDFASAERLYKTELLGRAGEMLRISRFLQRFDTLLDQFMQPNTANPLETLHSLIKGLRTVIVELKKG